MSDLRDEKLRHAILTAARINGEHRGGGWVNGATLADQSRDDKGLRASDDDHALMLLRSLVGLNLLEEEGQMHAGAKATDLRHRRYRITLKARELWMSAIAPVPGVWDERNEA